MDGVMCNDIRIGILVRISLSTVLWRKRGTNRYWERFSDDLITDAGGMLKLIEEYEHATPEQVQAEDLAREAERVARLSR